MSTSKFTKYSFLRKLLLEKSKTFCMAPWIHLHTTPIGVAAPCCIAESCASEDGVGNSRTQNLMEIVNGEKMSKLRLDMLMGVKNEECIKCYNQEEQGIRSFRQMLIDEMHTYFDEAIVQTNLDDGTLENFKMRYFDIRFSNICNFKCRTCGSGFSTQWEQEDLKNNVWYAKVHPKNDNKEFLQDIINQIDNMKTAYFAGGEPLITEEHYILLEEMIRSKRTDIKLRYNTNMSNLKFKDRDLISLWKNFTNGVDIYASIDHYGERAEFIRHGTNWVTVEENFRKVRSLDFVNIHMNTVLSVFNYLTIDQFYQYLVDKNLYAPHDKEYSLYNMSTPDHLAAHILPSEYKEKGATSINNAIKILTTNKFHENQINQLRKTEKWVWSKNTWEEQRDKFREEIKRLDKIRGEDFMKTFPEIANLYKVDRARMWPV